MSPTPRAPDGYHYLGVAPVEIDAGGRAHVSRENLRFAPEFGGAAATKGSGVMGIIGNALGGTLDFLSGNPDADADGDLADDFGGDNASVVRAWMKGKYAQSGTMRTDGTNLWSYALLIGTTDGSGGKVVYNHRSSQTTNRHINLARQYAHATLPAPFGGNPDADADGDLADDFGDEHYEDFGKRKRRKRRKRKRGKRRAPKALSPKVVKQKLGKHLKGKKWTKGDKLYITFAASLNKKQAAKVAGRRLKKKGIKYEGGISLYLYGVFPAPPFFPLPPLTPIGLWRAQVGRPGSTAKAVQSAKASKGGGKGDSIVPEPAQGALKSIPGREGGNVTPDWAQDHLTPDAGGGGGGGGEDAAVEARYQSAIQRLLADEFGLAFVDLSGDGQMDDYDDFGDDDYDDFGSDDEYIDLGSDDDFDDFSRKMLTKPQGGGRKRRSSGRKRPTSRPRACLRFKRSPARRLLGAIHRAWRAEAGVGRGKLSQRHKAAWISYMVSYTPQSKDEERMKRGFLRCQKALGNLPSTSTGGDPYASYLGGGCGCGR